MTMPSNLAGIQQWLSAFPDQSGEDWEHHGMGCAPLALD
jgi:hypothetical protein